MLAKEKEREKKQKIHNQMRIQKSTYQQKKKRKKGKTSKKIHNQTCMHLEIDTLAKEKE